MPASALRDEVYDKNSTICLLLSKTSHERAKDRKDQICGNGRSSAEKHDVPLFDEYSTRNEKKRMSRKEKKRMTAGNTTTSLC